MSEDTHGYDFPGEDAAASAARFRDLEETRASFQRTFESADGKRVLAFLRDFCKQHRASYVPGDVNETIYNEGRRSVLLLCMKYLHLDDEELLRLSMNQAQRRLRN